MGVDFKEAIQLFQESLDTEHDNRERCRQSDEFINEPNGQWEPAIIRRMSNRPRYTFDRCNPFIDKIMAEIDQSEFQCSVSPMNYNASKEVAIVYEGLIRTIENISTAEFIYNMAARSMIGTGLSGWRVDHDYVDDMSFDQDLIIKPIYNFHNRVWFDPDSIKPDASDSKACFLVTAMTREKYMEDFPDGTGMSLGLDDESQIHYYRRPDEMLIAEYFYLTENDVELVQMNTGQTYVLDDQFKTILDDLERINIRPINSRKTTVQTLKRRFFDGGDWITPVEDSVFDSIPIIPVYGNYNITEHKLTYRSAIERLMDPQRVLNYAESRKIEEGALAPREKIMMTGEQASGYEDKLSSMNINADPVQFYNHKEGQPQPYKMPGAQINPGLTETTQSMDTHINRMSGEVRAERDQGLGVQSGVALQRLEDRESSSFYKYFQSMEIAITRTCRILVDTIPKIYDTRRQVQLRGRDGSQELATLNDVVQDEQTGEQVEKNNVSQGMYEVVVSAGNSFKNDQQKTVEAIVQFAQVYPPIVEVGADILLNSVSAPGFDQIAERVRSQMVQSGVIPQDQLTDEEKQQVQAQQQQQQPPSPAEQALMLQAQTEAQRVQMDQVETMSKAQERQGKLQLAAQKQATDQQMAEMKMRETLGKLGLDQAKLPADLVNTQADTLKTLKDAMGVDAIVGPANQAAYINQARTLARQTAPGSNPGGGI